MPAFAPVAHEKAFVKVAAQISEAIERGEYAVGEMVPSERSLCRQMEVSRPVIPEAMSALQLIGVVRTRAGLGSFVANSLPRASVSKIWTLAAEESPTEVMERRQVLEPAAARLAALRLTPAGAAAMSELLDRMREIAAEVTDAGGFGKRDFQFHQAVADASGNGHQQVHPRGRRVFEPATLAIDA